MVVLTRTRRLARALRLRVAERRARDGVAVAEDPRIRTLDEWMAGLVDRLAPGCLLLGPALEMALWERVIAESGGAEIADTLDLRALAEQAARAHERLCWWGEPVWEQQPLSRDAAAFYDWLAAFRRRLADSRWVVAAQLPALFAAALEANAFDGAIPDSVALAGFERLEPVVARIAAALDKRGATVEIVAAAATRAASLVVRRADTRAEEVRAVAREIHARLLADPGLRIGVLAPDIGEVRGLLARVFEEELEAADLLDSDPHVALPGCFEISAAPAMTDYPLIAHALDLLSLQREAVSFEQASRVLLAPYPREAGAGSGAEPGPDDEVEFEGRALAEAELRRRSLARLPLGSGSSSQSLAAVARESGAVRFAQRLDDLAALLRKQPDADLPGRWRVSFIHRLDAMKWPGVLASEIEGILFRRWQEALAELAAMEVVTPSMTQPEALAHLRAICAMTTVQASSEGPPVQAMGLLDAAGLEFDVVYAIGMTSTAFPAAVRPSPLLPAVWQRLQKHPRASAEGEREFAERVWQRVCASAPEVIASYARSDVGGEQKSASALLPLHDAELPLVVLPWWTQPPGAAACCEPYSTAPAAAPLVRRGGSALIGNQAGCPFRAFATHRLGGEPLGRVEVQPNAALRGNLVHAALEEVYRRVRDQRALQRLSPNNLQALVERAVDVALAHEGGDLEIDVRGFARDWLIELVSNWLIFESRERRDAWAIEEVERPREARLPRGDEHGIEFHVRLDRIDRLENGGLLLIDFKTSFAAKTQTCWAGERPDEPQLPLYAALLAGAGERVEGMAFANLGARDTCSLVGLASQALGSRLGPAKIKKNASAAAPPFGGDFAVDLAAMQQCVEALARQYLRGDATVAPKRRTLCKNCAMESLCRVFESAAADGDGDEQTQEES